jgi:hypothetical protein
MICNNPHDKYKKCFAPCSKHIIDSGQCTCHNAFMNRKMIEKSNLNQTFENKKGDTNE